MNGRYKSLALGIIFILVALSSITMTGCRSKRTAVNTSTITDTVCIIRDSVVIRDRIVPVAVQLPGSTQRVEVPISHDTTSVLEDALYRSTATVRDGMLQHSLIAKRGARLTAEAHVQDTLRASRQDTAASSVRTVFKTETKEVNRLHWWQKALMWLGVIVTASYVGLVAVRRLKRG